MSLILRLAMPMLAVQLFVEVGVGILMKTIPQINIFVINIQAKILIGLVIFLILFFPMADFLLSLVNTLIQSMSDLLGSMRG
jgi:flagellar biosynthetic protein FliR